MFVLINIHSVVTKIKELKDYSTIGGMCGLFSQLISMCICFAILTTLTINIPTVSWILLILLILSACVTTGLIIKDFATGKTYDNKVVPEEQNNISSEEKKNISSEEK
jgi:hypothetical protein